MPSLGLPSPRNTLTKWNESNEGHYVARGMEYIMYKESLKRLGLFSLKKSSDFICLMGGYREVGARVFLEIHSERIGDSSHKLQQGKFLCYSEIGLLERLCNPHPRRISHLSGSRPLAALLHFNLNQTLKFWVEWLDQMTSKDAFQPKLLYYLPVYKAFVLNYTVSEPKLWPFNYWNIEGKKVFILWSCLFPVIFLPFFLPQPRLHTLSTKCLKTIGGLIN